MPLDFPSNPTNGQIFGSYIWSASKGVWQSREESAAPAIVSSVPPTTANPGDIWVDSSDGVSYVRYDDGNSAQWIEMMSSGVPSLTTKANLAGGNSFTGTQTFGTPIDISSGGTGSNTGVNLVPTGCIMMWYTNTPPTGWLICNGQSTTGYSSLAAIVGANVPNLQGRVPVGRDATQTEFDVLGETGGAKTHTLTTAEMPSHTHIQDSHNHGQNPHNHGLLNGGSTLANGGGTTANLSLGGGGYAITVINNATASNIATTATNQNTGGDGAHNNLQPYIVINYIIKT